MEKNHKLALYVGYFLARFNEEAYKILNYGNQGKTHIMIGNMLGVKPNTVKNMRDEFDPLFEFRAGWYQRPMSTSRIQVVEMLENFSFDKVHALVNDILISNGASLNSLEISSIVKDDQDNSEVFERIFTSRGVTGSKAESIFRNNFIQILPEFNGELIDTTLDGIGYDFKNSLGTIYIEVKGSANDQKGILLTDKEWEAAKRLGDRYYLVMIYLINEKPTSLVVKNPVKSLSPQLSIQKTITMNWNVSHRQMHELIVDPMELIIDLT
jgi:hypothetical protein